MNKPKQDADARAESQQLELRQATGAARIERAERTRRLKSAYHARGAKLAQAWSLARQALTV